MLQNTQRVSLTTIFKEKELWLLILLAILYFHRPLFLGETFYFRDLSSHDLPDKQLLVDFIQAGEFPLWDPYKHGGRPYLANIILFTFYPVNLLYLFLPLIKAFNLTIVLHFLWCSVFAYLFSRVIGFQPVSGFIVGVVYGFCGYVLSLANILNRILAIPYIPLLLLFWHLFLLERKRKWFVMAVIAGVAQVFTGAPETNVMSLLLLLGWALVYPYPQRTIRRKIILWLVLGIFITGIASIQLFPALEAVSQSSRGQGVDYNTFGQWSLHPHRLPEIIFPGFLGHLDNLLWDVYYWGKKLIDGKTPYILSMYFGWVVIALACVGGLHKGKENVLPFKVRIFFLALFVLSLMLSLGRYLPFFHFFYKYVPFMTIFRYPIKFLIIGIFPLAFLAGYGSEICFQRVRPVKILAILWGISAILLGLIVMFRFSDDFAQRFQQLIFRQVGGQIAQRGLIDSFTHTFIIWLLATLLYQYRRLKQRPWQHWMLAVILIIDLLVAGKTINLYAPQRFYLDIPDTVQFIRQEIDDGRFFRPKNDPSQYSLQVPSYDIMWLYQWRFEALKDYLAAFYRIPVIFHEDVEAMANFRLVQLTEFIHALPWEKRLPLLSSGGVTVILTTENLSVPGIQRITEIADRSDIPSYLYRNETAMARVEFVTSWEIVRSDSEAIRAMMHPDYDPRNHVVVQDAEITFSFPFLKKQDRGEDSPFKQVETLQHIQDTSTSDSYECQISPIKKLSSNFHSATFLFSSSCDGYLVFSEPFYPGWHVDVDRKSTPIMRANFAFSAIFLQAGEHEVARYYRPNSLLLGAFISALFCALLCLMGYKGWVIRVPEE